MPGKRSLYAKVRHVLGEAARSNADSSAGLVEDLLSAGIPAFLTRQYVEELDEYDWRPSANAVRRAVRVCAELQLLSEQGQLTDLGRQASTRESDYQLVVRTQAMERLTAAGASSESLRVASADLLSATPVTLPTSAALYDAVGPDMPRSQFARLLTLVADCGGAVAQQRKVYLEIL